MDPCFCPFLIFLVVFTGSITCYNPSQILDNEARKTNHHTDQENINYLVPENGLKRAYKTSSNGHLTKFETTRRIHRRSRSSEFGRSGKGRKPGRLSKSYKTVEGNEISAADRVRLTTEEYDGPPKISQNMEIKLGENNRDEYTKQIKGQEEHNGRSERVEYGFKNRKTRFSPIVKPDQVYINLPIHERQYPSKRLDRQKNVVGLRKYHSKGEHKDSSQRKNEIESNESEIEHSRYEIPGSKQKMDRDFSSENDNSKRDPRENVSSSAEDHDETSKGSRRKGIATSPKTRVLTLTTQSVNITAQPTTISSSFSKVTASDANTVQAGITRATLTHPETTPEVKDVTSSVLITTKNDFPTTIPNSANRMLTEDVFSTKDFFVTKSQTEAKVGTTSTVRSFGASPKDPVTIGPVRDYSEKQRSLPMTFVGAVSASVIAVAMIATSSFIGSRRFQLRRRRSSSIASLPENIELEGV